MKLYNHSSLPDAALETLLVAAARYAGARSSGLVVKITAARRLGMCGYYSLCVPSFDTWQSFFWRSAETLATPEQYARQLFELALHESTHIADYQARDRGVYRPFSVPVHGRRPRHDARPEEERANHAVWEFNHLGKWPRVAAALAPLMAALAEMPTPRTAHLRELALSLTAAAPRSRQGREGGGQCATISAS